MPHTSTFLVDDSPSFLQSAARFLASDERIEVVGVALSASEALREVARVQPALVLIDLNMPGMSGLEATRQLKALPNPPRVVVLTLHDTQEYRQAAEQAQADGFVAKSDFGQQLLPLLESLLEQDTVEPSAAPHEGRDTLAPMASPASAKPVEKGGFMARARSEPAPQVLEAQARLLREDVGHEEQLARSVWHEGFGPEPRAAKRDGAPEKLPARSPRWPGRMPRSAFQSSLMRGAGVARACHRVLLAEDRAEVSHILAVNMWRAGIETRIACDALSALELFDSFDPHLVLISAASPHLKASSVCRSIRERSDVPILLVVNPGSEGGSPGVEEVISRPGDVSHMTSRVLSLLSRFYPGAL